MIKVDLGDAEERRMEKMRVGSVSYEVSFTRRFSLTEKAESIDYFTVSTSRRRTKIQHASRILSALLC